MPALGRFVEHDEASRNFSAPVASVQKSVLHAHVAPVLDQGNLGSCTGNALAQCLNTEYFVHNLAGYLSEQDAVHLYARATTLDSDPDNYPPTDTGSSGLAVCKAGVQMGYLASYGHAFGFSHFTAALQLSPVIVGTSWTDSMMTPDKNGFVRPKGAAVGGHEYLAIGVDYEHKKLTFLNSWGAGWGDNGRFHMSFAAFSKLLADQGDVTVPIGK